MNLEKTVIDYGTPKANNATEKQRKILFSNLTDKQKSRLQAAAAGVGGLSLGALAVMLMSSKPIDTIDPLSPKTTPTVPAGNNMVEICIYTDAPFSDVVSDDMSFGSAFSAARQDVGPGGFFEWRGNTYNTYIKEEWDAMTSDEKNDFFASIDYNHTEEGNLDEQEIIAILNDEGYSGIDDHEDIVIVEHEEENPLNDISFIDEDDIQISTDDEPLDSNDFDIDDLG